MTAVAAQPAAAHLPVASARGWACLVLLWLFLFSPLVLWRAVQTTHEGTDWLFLFNVVATLLWAGLVQFSTRRPLRMHLALLPLYLTTAVDLFLLHVFRARLSSSYFATLFTDYDDTGEFFLTYGHQMLLVGLIALAVCATGFWGVRQLSTRPRPRLALLCGLGLLLVYGFAVLRDHRHGNSYVQAGLDLLAHEFSAPVGAVAQAALAADLLVVNRQYRAERAHFTFHANQSTRSGRQVFVLVIGESSRLQNWELFGYRRPTTPLLRTEHGVIGLSHVLTTAPMTFVAVPSLVSLSPITHWSQILGHKSIVTAFNEAGFDTYWISAQQVDTFGGSIPEIAAEAHSRRYYDQGFDQQLLGDLKRILAAAAGDARILIVLHTKGSHFEYSRRYPVQFAHFVTENATRKQQLVDAYDNSVLYTDFILHEVIAALKAVDGVTAMMYASDHGENLLDDERQLLGHGLGNEYDLHPPAVLWLSERYRSANALKAAQLQAHAAAPISLSNLSHSLLGMAGIRADGLNETLDLSSEQFAPQPRYYQLGGALYKDRATTESAAR